MTSRERQWIVAGLCSVALVASAVVAFDRSRQPIDASGDPVFGVTAGDGEPTATSAESDLEVAEETNTTQGLVTVPLGPTASTTAPVDAVRSPSPSPRPTAAPNSAPTTPTVDTTPTTEDSTTVTDPTSSETSETSETTATTEDTTTSSTDEVTTTSVSLPIDTLPTLPRPGRGDNDDD
ncbi:MAG: hypothetical protein AAF962_04825 [Actinomycetota bacterium]